MAYFAAGVSRDKLIILYFLNTLGLELTRTQLTTVFGQTDILPYFDLQSAVYELETDGFLAAVPRPFGQAYGLTERGREALEMFYESLPQSLRKELDSHAENGRDNLRRETQFQAKSEKLGIGYRVSLRVLERDSELLHVQLVLPDAQSAKAACESWPDRAEGVYQGLLAGLL